MLSKLIIFLLLLLVSCKQNNLSTSGENLLIIVSISLMVVVLLFLFFLAQARIERIKKIYFNSKNKLHFWDKLDRIKFETMLQNKKIPKNWIVKLNTDKNKIEDIYFYDGLSVGRIAQDKEKLFDSLRNRIKNNK